MRVAVLYAPGDVRVEERARPRPGPGEVLLRVEAALLDDATAELVERGATGRGGGVVLELGRAGAGVVEEKGERVEHVALGDRVVPAWVEGCGHCPACERGLASQCRAPTRLPGTCADLLLVPEPIGRSGLCAAPPHLAPETAALAGTLACVLKARDRVPMRAGERAVVIGAGLLGLLWTRVLALLGLEVTTVDDRVGRLAKAHELGAAAVAETRAGGSRPADVVVETAGTRTSWRDALAAGGPGARVVLCGEPPPGTTVSLDAGQALRGEVWIVSSHLHTPHHVREALQALGQGLLDPRLLLGDEVGLEDLPALARRPRTQWPLVAVVRP